MGLLLMNMAQISMVLMKTQGVIVEVFKVILKTAVIGAQAFTIFLIYNGTILDYIRNLIQSAFVG